MPRFAAEKEFIHKAAKRGDWEQVSDPPPQRWGAWVTDGIKKQDHLRHGVPKVIGGGQRWGSWCSAQAHLGYMLLHRMHVEKWGCLVSSEGGVFGPLTLKVHSSDTCTGPVLGSVVPTSLSQLELNESWLQAPEKQFKPPLLYCSDPYIELLSIGVVKESCDILPRLHEAWRVCI